MQHMAADYGNSITHGLRTHNSHNARPPCGSLDTLLQAAVCMLNPWVRRG